MVTLITNYLENNPLKIAYSLWPRDSIAGIYPKETIREIQGGRGVSGSYTNLLPGPIWNYN